MPQNRVSKILQTPSTLHSAFHELWYTKHMPLASIKRNKVVIANFNQHAAFEFTCQPIGQRARNTLQLSQQPRKLPLSWRLNSFQTFGPAQSLNLLINLQQICTSCTSHQCQPQKSASPTKQQHAIACKPHMSTLSVPRVPRVTPDTQVPSWTRPVSG